MEEQKDLLGIIQRLVTDEDFRAQFMTMPKETLIAELQLSGEHFDALRAFLPVVLAGGSVILADVAPPGTTPIFTGDWSGWGR